MFKALVTICVIGLPPYETEFDCKQRALQISRQIHKYYPLWKPTKYKCSKLPEGRLKWTI